MLESILEPVFARIFGSAGQATLIISLFAVGLYYRKILGFAGIAKGVISKIVFSLIVLAILVLAGIVPTIRVSVAMGYARGAMAYGWELLSSFGVI